MRVKEWLAEITYEHQWADEKGLRSGQMGGVLNCRRITAE